MESYRTLQIVVGIIAAEFGGLFQAQSRRNVAVQRVVRAGLVGEQIGDDAAARQFRNDVGAIAHQAHGHGIAFAHRVFENANRLVQELTQMSQ